jgi:hypothetical protein
VLVAWKPTVGRQGFLSGRPSVIYGRQQRARVSLSLGQPAFGVSIRQSPESCVSESSVSEEYSARSELKKAEASV